MLHPDGILNAILWFGVFMLAFWIFGLAMGYGSKEHATKLQRHIEHKERIRNSGYRKPSPPTIQEEC